MPKPNQNYFAIIGDLVGSRAMEPKERVQVQKRFQTILDKANKDFRDEIASLFLITAGDETQGVLKRPDFCCEIIRQIQIELTPTEIVFGLGYGPLTTALGEYAVGADGPAFYLARQALVEAKEERKAYGKSILREVRLHSEAPLRDATIDSLFLAVSLLKSHWTVKQAKILKLLQQGKTTTETAKFLKIPLSNISRTVEKTHFRELELLFAALRQIFHEGFNKSG